MKGDLRQSKAALADCPVRGLQKLRTASPIPASDLQGVRKPLNEVQYTVAGVVTGMEPFEAPPTYTRMCGAIRQWLLLARQKL